MIYIRNIKLNGYISNANLTRSMEYQFTEAGFELNIYYNK